MYNEFLKRYPSTAFISLAYHAALGLPISDRTDPLPPGKRLVHVESPSGKSGQRYRAFGDWLDGNIYLDDMDGEDARGRAVDSELKRPPEAFLHLQTSVKKGSIVARVKVDSVIGKHPKTYLHIVVVEDTVNLLGDGKYESLPRQVHHMVVRAFAHTDKILMALPLKAPGTVEYTFNMAAVQAQALSGTTRVGSRRWSTGRGAMVMSLRLGLGALEPREATERQLAKFPDERDWRMDPLRLHVVAFVQDAETAEVLQAVMVNLGS